LLAHFCASLTCMKARAYPGPALSTRAILADGMTEGQAAA